MFTQGHEIRARTHGLFGMKGHNNVEQIWVFFACFVWWWSRCVLKWILYEIGFEAGRKRYNNIEYFRVFFFCLVLWEWFCSGGLCSNIILRHVDWMRFTIHGMAFDLSHGICVSEPVDFKSRPYSPSNCRTTPFDHPKPIWSSYSPPPPYPPNSSAEYCKWNRYNYKWFLVFGLGNSDNFKVSKYWQELKLKPSDALDLPFQTWPVFVYMQWNWIEPIVMPIWMRVCMLLPFRVLSILRPTCTALVAIPENIWLLNEISKSFIEKNPNMWNCGYRFNCNYIWIIPLFSRLKQCIWHTAWEQINTSLIDIIENFLW